MCFVSLCVCVKLKRIIVLTLCLPREGKNTQFVCSFVLVFLSFRSSRGFVIICLILLYSHHHMRHLSTQTSPQKTQTCLLLHVLSTREIMQACQSSSIFTARRCVLSAAKRQQMNKQRISTTVKAQEFIATDKAPAAAGPYSQGIKVYRLIGLISLVLFLLLIRRRHLSRIIIIKLVVLLCEE